MTISNNIKNNPIAFFDSGFGGLSVLDKVKRILPNESYIYFGDTLHVPYGEKTKEDLLEYSKNILELFVRKKCKAVVMACNTTSSTIYEEIKDKYPFKIYPIVQSVSQIIGNLEVNRLGIFATKATVNSKAYEKEIEKYNKNITVYSQYCPQWVYIVENNKINDEKYQLVIKSDLEKMLLKNPDKIVLGCTHYPFLIDVLSKFAARNLFIDPAVYFSQYIKDDLQRNNLLSEEDVGKEEFYVSSNPKKFQENSRFIYEISTLPLLYS